MRLSSTNMDARKVPISLSKILYIYLMITFCYFLLFYLLKEVPEIFFMKNIIASLGGGSALSYVFISKNFLSRVSTLYSFFMSSYVLLICKDFLDLDLAIVVLLSLSVSFFFAFFFCENRNLFPFFLLALLLFIQIIGLEWSISFLVEFIILFGLVFLEDRFHLQKKKEIFISFCLLVVTCFYFYFLELNQSLSIREILFLAAAGAGGLQFLCLNKTEQGQVNGFYLDFVSNVVLGLLLKKEGETFPQITLLFLLSICSFLIFLFLLSRFKEESLSSVISHSKTLLRGVFFPILYFLDSFFVNSTYCLWVSSFTIHVFILLLFKFIFKNEEKDPILENEEKG